MQDNFDHAHESDATDAAPAGNGSGAPATTPATAVTVPPGMKLVDPFEHYAAKEGGDAFFDGDYARLDQKLGWLRGQQKQPIDATEAWVANMHEARHGWISFSKSDSEGVQRHTVLIVERPELPPCPACGGTADEHDNPKLCDWRPTVYLPLRSVTDPGDVICFTGSGKGARRAVAQLCGVYARPGADRQGKSPTLMLATKSFENSSGGTTTWPVFKLIGWEYFTPNVPTPETRPITVPLAPPAKTATAKLAGKRGDMDDEIPF